MNRRRVRPEERSERTGALLRRLASGLVRVLGVLAASALVVYGAVAGWAWLTTSDRFVLRRVELHGVERAPSAELVRLAGLTEGRNVFSVDLAQAALAVEQSPWVKRARVVRDLPDGVRVEVEEHVARALVSVPGGLYAVDAEGLAFKRALPSDRLDLPVVTGLSRDTFAGDRRSVDPELRVALALMAAYERHGMDARAPLSEVGIGEEGGESAFTLWCGDEPVQVRLGVLESGDIEGIDARLERLARVWDELRRRGARARSIDLGNRLRPDWVAARLE